MDTRGRPRHLDLFCGAGGAAWGYWMAGFAVTGVDTEPQPDYPFAFIQADALTFPLAGYDAVHASPLCMRFARVTEATATRAGHPDTLTPTLARLEACDLPWVVENVPEAPMRADYVLCGCRFGLPVMRRRKFAVSWQARQPAPRCRCADDVTVFAHKQERAYADAMGCGWMGKRAARQAIPPAYTHYLGQLLMDQVRERRASCAGA
jgi:DNA (cytosine-5)-methyltransferase 1